MITIVLQYVFELAWSLWLESPSFQISCPVFFFVRNLLLLLFLPSNCCKSSFEQVCFFVQSAHQVLIHQDKLIYQARPGLFEAWLALTSVNCHNYKLIAFDISEPMVSTNYASSKRPQKSRRRRECKILSERISVLLLTDQFFVC